MHLISHKNVFATLSISNLHVHHTTSYPSIEVHIRILTIHSEIYLIYKYISCLMVSNEGDERFVPLWKLVSTTTCGTHMCQRWPVCQGTVHSLY